MIRKLVRRRVLLVAAIGAFSLLALPSPGLAAIRATNASLGLGPVEHISANGLSIGYRTGGRGPWLIMVMGRSGTMAEWDPQLIRQLTRDHRVLIFDNRGMGTTDSSLPASDVTVPLMAEDTLALASALRIERFDLMGWSMGGEISQQVTVDAPSRVNKLVLCATSAGGSTEHAPSAPIEKIMDDPQLPTWTLFGLSFPPTAAGVKGAFDYAARVSAQYVHAHLPSDSFTESAGRDGRAAPRARTVGLVRRRRLRRPAQARHRTFWSCGATSTWSTRRPTTGLIVQRLKHVEAAGCSAAPATPSSSRTPGRWDGLPTRSCAEAQRHQIVIAADECADAAAMPLAVRICPSGTA